MRRSRRKSRFCEVPCEMHRTRWLCFICSVVPEEVTNASLHVPDPSKEKKFQESYSLKRTGKSLYAGSDTLENYLPTLVSSCLQLKAARLQGFPLRSAQSTVKLRCQSFVLYTVCGGKKKDGGLGLWKSRSLLSPKEHFLFFRHFRMISHTDSYGKENQY